MLSWLRKFMGHAEQRRGMVLVVDDPSRGATAVRDESEKLRRGLRKLGTDYEYPLVELATRIAGEDAIVVLREEKKQRG